jgi:hypothetical protein
MIYRGYDRYHYRMPTYLEILPEDIQVAIYKHLYTSILNDINDNDNKLLNFEDISKKISRFAHEVTHVLNSKSFNIEALSDKNHINEKIKNMDDIYGRKNIKLKVVDIDTSFPKEIFDNVYKYQDLIKQKII